MERCYGAARVFLDRRELSVVPIVSLCQRHAIFLGFFSERIVLVATRPIESHSSSVMVREGDIAIVADELHSGIREHRYAEKTVDSNGFLFLEILEEVDGSAFYPDFRIFQEFVIGIRVKDECLYDCFPIPNIGNGRTVRSRIECASEGDDYRLGLSVRDGCRELVGTHLHARFS